MTDQIERSLETIEATLAHLRKREEVQACHINNLREGEAEQNKKINLLQEKVASLEKKAIDPDLLCTAVTDTLRFLDDLFKRVEKLEGLGSEGGDN